MSYFDIDDILMGEEKVPTVATIDVIKLGHLDTGSVTPYLEQGAKLDVPIWLVKEYRQANQSDVFKPQLPKCFNKQHLDTLAAEPEVVNLHSWCPSFFGFALDYLRLVNNDDLNAIIMEAFSRRYTAIMDMSQTAAFEDTNDRTRILTTLERQLFRLGAIDDREYQHWQTRTHRILPSPATSRQALGLAAKRAKVSGDT
eukprot:m.95332 g.95332  ORF g.95332 m.95332 type:complete len:199 (-) comp13056_c0_seq1:2709-3305(-)